MSECCANCKHWKRLKHNFVVGKGFEESHCCVVFVDDFILETKENGMCEMFTAKGGAV